MTSRLADSLLQLLPRAGVCVLSRTRFIPVLHVERLQDDSSFARTLAFAEGYLGATGERALLTVITPMAPMLAMELKAAGLSEDFYRERIGSLARFADIGLHGHYLREPSSPIRPVHNYWNEASIIAAQIELERDWLERRGLMTHRAYSAGWWHLDAGLVKTLAALGFRMDFSSSTARFNDSPGAVRSERFRRSPVIFAHPDAPGILAVWAVSSLGDSAARSFVVRRALTAFPKLLFRKEESFLSLYSHDWDLNVEGALKTVETLKAHGAGFVSLQGLLDRGLAGSSANQAVPS
ncbi:hypothetical protein [Arenimonas sp. MALMAid1274]|uniref:hypothetical protein n=1 Tax=Arenimonas sp. MALMAid1274 TaxID=3411630 RepID=UPI003B9DC8EC